MLTSKIKVTVAAILLATSGLAAALPTASVNLSSFIQDGNITNNAASGANLTSFTYNLGTAGDGIATWEVNSGTTLAGSTSQTNFLPFGDWFQTANWTGLNVAPGGVFAFSGLDIDLIVSLSGQNVTGSILDTVGTSLANASVTLGWSDGSSATCSLVQQPWATNQNLSCGASTNTNPIPEPSSLALLGLGFGALVASRRRRKAI